VLLATVAAAGYGLVALDGVFGGAKPGQGRFQGGLVVAKADQQGVTGRHRLGEPVLLAMQSIGGDAELGHQLRAGQKNNIARRWAKKGSRPSAPHDQRKASTYIFGAICPQDGKPAGLILPWRIMSLGMRDWTHGF